MDYDIHEKLISLTEEERKILDGSIEIDKKIYTDDKSFIIDSDKLLHNGELIDVRKHTRFIKFPKHRHNYIEFNYVYSGVLKENVAGNDIELKKGEILFLNQHIEHEIEISGKNDIAINFIIKPEFFDYIISLLENDNPISKFLITTMYTDYENGEYIYFRVSKDENIQDMVEKIIVELYNPGIMSSVKIKLLVALLIVELIKDPDNTEIYCSDNYEKMIIGLVLNYIEEHYKDATLFDIAERVKQPHYKISKLVKKHTNYTFKELLQEKRLNKAVELLKAGNIPVNDIMEAVGYENPTYFYKIFKEKYKVTPKQYKIMNNL